MKTVRGYLRELQQTCADGTCEGSLWFEPLEGKTIPLSWVKPSTPHDPEKPIGGATVYSEDRRGLTIWYWFGGGCSRIGRFTRFAGATQEFNATLHYL